MKKMRKMKRFNEGGSSYTGDDPIVKYRMGKMSADEANIALGRPDMVKGSLSQEEEKSPVSRSVAKPAAPVESAKAEPAKAEPVKLASNINPEDGKEYTPVDQAAPYKNSSLVSSPPIRKPAAKPSDKSADKAETKAETKTETKVEPKDDKPVPVKVVKDEKPKARPKTPGITDTSAEEKVENRSRLYEGIKSIFSGPAKYIERGSPAMREMRAKDALKSGMASKDRDSMRKGGSVKMASGGKVSSASKRADGCAIRGKTRA